MKIRNREFVSFDGMCPYQCKHCFSFDMDHNQSIRTKKEIVDSLKDKDFDVVYVSQKKENFINPDDGLELCEMLFNQYCCNIVIITRNIFNSEHQKRLITLHNNMKEKGRFLFVCISLVGLDSSGITENLSLIPSPEERIRFAKEVYNLGIKSILLIRPLFPSKIIPSTEWKKIIDMVAGNISCVLTGALMVNDYINQRLGMRQSDWSCFIDGNSEYLNGAVAEQMKFVDVRNEMSKMKDYCQKNDVPFFEHSMPALNYLITISSSKN